MCCPCWSDYDGGDCCECTCVSSVEYTCGENGGYACIDPSAPCVDNDDVTELPSFEISCITQYIADGDCDAENNFEECGKSCTWWIKALFRANELDSR